jgi:hypothetical protein
MRYPAGSIQSQEIAERALREAVRERLAIEARYKQDQQACSPKFFATSCLEAAKEHRRYALARVRAVEVDANAFKRRARVIERDQGLAERSAQAPPVPPKHIERQGKASAIDSQSSDAAASMTAGQTTSGEIKQAVNEPTVDSRVADHEAKLRQLRARELADQPKRDANVTAYEKRARDAEARQREIASQKAKKEKERMEKEQQASKPQ